MCCVCVCVMSVCVCVVCVCVMSVCVCVCVECVCVCECVSVCVCVCDECVCVMCGGWYIWYMVHCMLLDQPRTASYGLVVVTYIYTVHVHILPINEIIRLCWKKHISQWID